MSSTAPAVSQAVADYVKACHAAGVPRDQLENFLRAGVILQPKQLSASALARQCDHEDGPTALGFGGARGGGKSHWGLAQVACDDCQRYPGLKFLYLRKVGKSGNEAIQDLRRSVLARTPHQFKEQKGMIVFPNGSRIFLGHYKDEKDVDKYLGLEYDGALIEEYTQLSSSKVKMIRTCIRTSKPGWRPRIYATTNPGGIGHQHFKTSFIKPFRSGSESRTRFIPATVRDNSFVNREYRQSLEDLTGWMREAWLNGDWDIAAGQYFTTWRYDVHVKPAYQIPLHWRVWLALDYGYTHYTAIYLFAQDDDGHVYVVDEHCERKWMPPRHADAVKAMLKRHNVLPGRIETFVAGGDVFMERGNDETIAQAYERQGFALDRADMARINGWGEVLRRLGDVDMGIAPSITIFDTCPRLIECIPALEHNPNRPEDVLKVDTDEDGIGGDDPGDAFRYGLMVAARDPGGASCYSYTH